MEVCFSKIILYNLIKSICSLFGLLNNYNISENDQWYVIQNEMNYIFAAIIKCHN